MTTDETPSADDVAEIGETARLITTDNLRASIKNLSCVTRPSPWTWAAIEVYTHELQSRADA